MSKLSDYSTTRLWWHTRYGKRSPIELWQLGRTEFMGYGLAAIHANTIPPYCAEPINR
ncbi:hypothetical protein [Nitrosomonas sp.]|uniref:hypothetical protein n=1 Tax=Nitrosomonas sp. TaxID=42353 RepID=UPI00374CC8C2